MKSPEELVSQVWCLPEHSHKVMDVALANSFVEIIQSERTKVEELKDKIAVLTEEQNIDIQAQKNFYLEKENSELEQRIEQLEGAMREIEITLSHKSFLGNITMERLLGLTRKALEVSK